MHETKQTQHASHSAPQAEKGQYGVSAIGGALAHKLDLSKYWYDETKHSVVDRDERLKEHRADVEILGKKANFFGNISRYAWFAALPVFGMVAKIFTDASALAATEATTTFAAALGAQALPLVGALAASVVVMGLGFWASQKAETFSVQKLFETSAVNAKTTAKEISKEMGKNTEVSRPSMAVAAKSVPAHAQASEDTPPHELHDVTEKSDHHASEKTDPSWADRVGGSADKQKATSFADRVNAASSDSVTFQRA